MEKIKFNNGTSYELHGITSSGDDLDFTVYDEDPNTMIAFLKNDSNTSIIKLVDVKESEEVVRKGYSRYEILAGMNVAFNVVTDINYDVEDASTDSGFQEIKHDVLTFTLKRKSKIEKLEDGQTIQDGAIEDLAEAVSDLSA